jgi:site-specific DNA-cytosine methylase
MPSIISFNETGHEKWCAEAIAGSLNAHESKEFHTIIGTLNGTQRQQVDGAMTAQLGVPRRLMPIECERLMDWPDNWTNVPDEKGKPASDAVRYRACGNGVVSAVPEWIGRRIIALYP